MLVSKIDIRAKIKIAIKSESIILIKLYNKIEQLNNYYAIIPYLCYK